MNAPDPGTDQIDAAFRAAKEMAKTMARRPGVKLIDFAKPQPRAVSDWWIGHVQSLDDRRIRTCLHVNLMTQLCYMIGWAPHGGMCAPCYAPVAEAYATSIARTANAARYVCVFCDKPCGAFGPISFVAAVPPTILLMGGACHACAGLRVGV